jgi:hypothetical protein
VADHPATPDSLDLAGATRSVRSRLAAAGIEAIDA